MILTVWYWKFNIDNFDIGLLILIAGIESLTLIDDLGLITDIDSSVFIINIDILRIDDWALLIDGAKLVLIFDIDNSCWQFGNYRYWQSSLYYWYFSIDYWYWQLVLPIDIAKLVLIYNIGNLILIAGRISLMIILILTIWYKYFWP